MYIVKSLILLQRCQLNTEMFRFNNNDFPSSIILLNSDQQTLCCNTSLPFFFNVHFLLLHKQIFMQSDAASVYWWKENVNAQGQWPTGLRVVVCEEQYQCFLFISLAFVLLAVLHTLLDFCTLYHCHVMLDYWLSWILCSHQWGGLDQWERCRRSCDAPELEPSFSYKFSFKCQSNVNV